MAGFDAPITAIDSRAWRSLSKVLPSLSPVRHVRLGLSFD
jgi:hypothetical protein